MTYDERLDYQLELANKIVEHAFKDKKDLAGQPYVNHLNRVADRVSGKECKTIALLHDILEDCPEWTEGALRCLFDENIIDAVVCLTRDTVETYEYYIDRLKGSPISYAVKVKIADLIDNMNIARLPVLTDKDFDRLKKYHKAYKVLNP